MDIQVRKIDGREGKWIRRMFEGKPLPGKGVVDAGVISISLSAKEMDAFQDGCGPEFKILVLDGKRYLIDLG